MGKILDVYHALNECNNKRDNKIEKTQLEVVTDCAKKLINRYETNGYNFSLCVNTKMKDKSYFLTEDGILTSNKELKNIYSTKTFDAFLIITKKNEQIKFYFSLKGVENCGGHQDNVVTEIVRTSEIILKNNDKNVFFCFLLDGNYINKKINDDKKGLRKNKKYFVTDSENLYYNIDYKLNKIFGF